MSGRLAGHRVAEEYQRKLWHHHYFEHCNYTVLGNDNANNLSLGDAEADANEAPDGELVNISLDDGEA